MRKSNWPIGVIHGVELSPYLSQQPGAPQPGDKIKMDTMSVCSNNRIVPEEDDRICYFCHKSYDSVVIPEDTFWGLGKDSIHRSCCQHLKPEHLTETFLSWEDSMPLPFCKKCLFCTQKLSRMNDKLEEIQRKIDGFVHAFTVEFLKSRKSIYNSKFPALTDKKDVDTAYGEVVIKQEQVDAVDDVDCLVAEASEMSMDDLELEDIYSGYESSEGTQVPQVEMKFETNPVAPRRGRGRPRLNRDQKKPPKNSKQRKYNKKIQSQQLRVNLRRQCVDSEGNPIPERNSLPRRKAAVKAEATFSSWATDLGGREEIVPEYVDTHPEENNYMSEESNSSWKKEKKKKLSGRKSPIKARTRGRPPKMKVESFQGERIYKCTECEKTYKNRHHLLEHEITHDKNKRFQCTLCDASFSYVRNLRKHLIRHDKNEPLDRRRMRKSGEKGTKKVTKSRDGKPKSYICKICTKVCNTAGHLFYHSQSHKNAEGEFKCELCSKVFKNAVTFQKHGKIHTGENKFLCSVCGKEFKSRSGQKDHELLHFEDKNERLSRKDFECQVCHKVYSSKSSLNKHSFRHSAEKQFGCGQCDKKFATKGGLQTHMIYHKGERPFLCEECGKSFFTKTKLNEHNRIHTGMLFPCEYCDKGFQTTTHLKQHYRSHNKKIDKQQEPLEPPPQVTEPFPNFQCTTCDVKFDSQNSLSNHLLIHSEEFSRFLMFNNN